MSHQCGTCGQNVTDQAAICWSCTGALQLDLQKIGGYRHPDGRWIPGLLADLLTAGTGTARIPQQGGPDDDDSTRRTLDSRYPATTSAAGSPGNPAAMALHHEIRTDLIGWVRCLLSDELTSPLGVNANPSQWLEQRTHLIRRHDWAPAMLADCDRHLNHAERLVDLPAALTVPCPWCTQRVAIDPEGPPVIECRCGKYGTVDWWVDQVAPPLPSEPLTLAQIPGWLRTRGYDVTAKQVEHWADRGQLPYLAGTGGQGRAREFAARTILETAEKSAARRIIPTSMTR